MCEDQAPGGWRPGGPSLFSAVAAARLGARVTLIGAPASGHDHFSAGIDVCGSGDPARYANHYDTTGARTQLLLRRGSPLSVPALPPAAVVIIAPAFHELTSLPSVASDMMLGVALQGAMRSVDSMKRVWARRDPWRAARPLLRAGAWAFLSEEDTPGHVGLARRCAASGVATFVTAGAKGATLYWGEQPQVFSAYPAAPVDPTGAGDCFATAFIVRFAETRDVETAARFASAAGALAVEGHGLAGVPDRATIEARLERVAA